MLIRPQGGNAIELKGALLRWVKLTNLEREVVLRWVNLANLEAEGDLKVGVAGDLKKKQS